MGRHVPPFETDITHLGPKGTGIGRAPGGQEVRVRAAPPGARLAVQVFGRKKGVLLAKRTGVVRPPEDGAVPRCAAFGTCGGCTLQELSLEGQRRHKHAFAVAEVGDLGPDVVVHPMRGAPDGYAYRNKVELSFGRRRWLAEGESGEKEGAFLGFHAPGRFDAVVDVARCELVSEAANQVIAAFRALLPGSPAPWDPRIHEGFWRHLRIREHAGRRLVELFTGDDRHPEQVERAREAVGALADGFRWVVNPERADVARGTVRGAWGVERLAQALGDAVFDVGPDSFFQTNTEATKVLYDTVGELVGTGGHLLDLYCGSGTIGQFLGGRFARVTGIEENADAIADARRNAVRNRVVAEYHAGRVEDLLAHVGPCDAAVVDPPRVGLHPRVAAHVAALDAPVLVYVACHPASLGADAAALRAGGWRCTDLVPVDLFPQTGHVEVVARFVRDPVPSGAGASS